MCSGERYLDIFDMRGTASLEHAVSTGVRGTARPGDAPYCAVFPCRARFDDFWAPFATGGRLYLENFAEIVCKAISDGYRGQKYRTRSSKFGRELEVRFAYLIPLAFGRLDETGRLYVPLADAETMELEGRYPEGWQRRPWGGDRPTCVLRPFAAEFLRNSESLLRSK